MVGRHPTPIPIEAPVTNAPRRIRVAVITDAAYLAMIHETATLAQSARFPETVVDHVKGQLTGLFDLRMCRFESGSLLGHPSRRI
jgi:hypothetical protein